MDVDLSQVTKPCPCGEDQDAAFPQVYIEAGVAEKLVDVLEEYQNPVFICDSNTRAAAEPHLEDEFKDYPVIELDPEGLITDEKSLQKVLRQVEYCEEGCGAVCVDVLVAIGAGTVHDFTRYCAKAYGVDYISVPTAASSSGFASRVAVVMKDGEKTFLPANYPKYILADTDIFGKAPRTLTETGIAKLKMRYDGFDDWEEEQPDSEEESTDMLEKALKKAVRDIDDIRDGEEDAMEKLMYALILSGLMWETNESV